jgi:hypothetical protein
MMTINAALIYTHLGESVKPHYGLYVKKEDVEYLFTFTIHKSKDNTHISFTKEETEQMVSTPFNTIGNFVFVNLASMNKADRITHLRYLTNSTLNDQIEYIKLDIFECNDLLHKKVIEVMELLK